MPNECNDLLPSMCGRSRLPTLSDAACRSIYFTGIADVSVNQGDNCIDLTAGVHAFNGSGVEIPFTVSPTEIDCCKVGEYEITYTATGEGDKMLPTLCLGDSMLHVTECGLETATERRIITIKPYGKVCESKTCCATVICTPHGVVCEAKVCEVATAC